MKYFKIHQKYLINKVNIIVISLLIVLFCVLALISIKDFTIAKNFFYSDNIIKDLLDNILIYTKIVLIPFICFFFGNSFTKDQDDYHVLFPSYYKHKKRYYISKLLLLAFVCFIIEYISFFIFSISSSLSSSWYTTSNSLREFYFNVYLVCIVYGLISIICSICIPSTLSSFLPIGLYIIGEIIKDIPLFNNLYTYYYLLIPTIEMPLSLSVSNVMFTYYGELHLLLIILLYGVISLILFEKRKS